MAVSASVSVPMGPSHPPRIAEEVPVMRSMNPDNRLEPLRNGRKATAAQAKSRMTRTAKW